MAIPEDYLTWESCTEEKGKRKKTPQKQEMFLEKHITN